MLNIKKINCSYLINWIRLRYFGALSNIWTFDETLQNGGRFGPIKDKKLFVFFFKFQCSIKHFSFSWLFWQILTETMISRIFFVWICWLQSLKMASSSSIPPPSSFLGSLAWVHCHFCLKQFSPSQRFYVLSCENVSCYDCAEKSKYKISLNLSIMIDSGMNKF